MSKEQYVLFSPVGKTDPMRDNYDGPAAHIVRHYLPICTRLFLTKELLDAEQKYGTYSGVLQLINPSMTVFCSEHEEISDPSDFERFIPLFEQELRSIYNDYPKQTILLNISSGTAQMIAALCTIAAYTDLPVKCIQVKTPANRSNSKTAFESETDPQLIYENMLDNEKGAANRCIEVRLDNYVRRNTLNTLHSMIKKGNYAAAKAVADQNERYLPPAVKSAVNGAWERKQLEYDSARGRLHSAVANNVITKARYTDLLEFYLGVRHDLDTGDYVRFFARLSTLVVESLKTYLSEQCEVPFDRITTEGFKLEPERLREYDEPLFNHVKTYMRQEPRKVAFSMSSLNAMLSYFCSKDPGMHKQLLRTSEEITGWIETRNDAVHAIKPITRQVVESQYDCSVSEMKETLDRFVLLALGHTGLKADDLDSYSQMNDAICVLINRAAEKPLD